MNHIAEAHEVESIVFGFVTEELYVLLTDLRYLVGRLSQSII